MEDPEIMDLLRAWGLPEVGNLFAITKEDHKNLAAILSLPELINPSIVALPSTTSDPPEKKKTGQKATDKRWKLTKAESREAFITHIQDDSYIKLVINKRHTNLTEKGFAPQPCVMMVGLC